jgi:hypothetical protein
MENPLLSQILFYTVNVAYKDILLKELLKILKRVQEQRGELSVLSALIVASPSRPSLLVEESVTNS